MAAMADCRVPLFVRPNTGVVFLLLTGGLSAMIGWWVREGRDDNVLRPPAGWPGGWRERREMDGLSTMVCTFWREVTDVDWRRRWRTRESMEDMEWT